MRNWPRIAVIAGLALAWVGLKLTWERWSSLSDGGSTPGFDLPEAKLFVSALAVVSVLGVAYAVRPWKPLSIALTLGACVLIGFAARVALDLYGTGGTFVDDQPALGLWVSVAGAVVVIVATRPIPYALAAGLVPLLAVALWPVGGTGAGRLDPVVTEDVGETMALDGDTVLGAAPSAGQEIYAFDPDGERSRLAFDLAGVKSGFVERTDGMARQGDVLYVSVTNTGLLRIPLHGKPQMVAEGHVAHPDGAPDGHPLQVPGFRPSRLAAAPDGSLYVLSGERVYRYAQGKLAPVAGTGERGLAGDGGPAASARFDAPQDIEVDRQGRLFIADTGNGRVRRVDRDGRIRTILGGDAAPGCAQQGGDEPESLDPARCHAIEALAVDSHGNVFVATGGISRVLALTPAGRYGVVAGTGLAGDAMGDGRAVSARIGAVNVLAAGPDDDLYIGEFDRVLRVADPLEGLGAKPAPAGPAAPRSVCRAVADWGAATFASDVVHVSPPEPDALVAAIGRLDGSLPGAADLKRAVAAAQDKTYSLQPGATAGRALADFGEESCGLFRGLYPLSGQQATRFCLTYLHEWDRVDAIDARRTRAAARKSAALLPESMFPRDTSRHLNWEGPVEILADGCGIPYRWATRGA